MPPALLPTDVWNLNIQQLHKSLPPFQPIIPVSLLPYLAFILLTLTFGLAFYFSTSVLFTSLHFTSSHLYFSLQSAERDGQGIDGSNPRERTRRFRNGSHVLYCRGIRIKNTLPICFRKPGHIWAP